MPNFSRSPLVRLATAWLALVASMPAAWANPSLTPLSSFGTNGWLAPESNAYLGTGNTERGFGWDPVSKNLVLPSRNGGNFVAIINGTTGSVVRTLDSTGVSGGTLAMMGAGVSDDGKVFICNLQSGSSALSPFKVYEWASVSDANAPTVAFSAVNPATTSGGWRFGDAFDVIGSGTSLRFAAAGATTGTSNSLANNGNFMIGKLDGSNTNTIYRAIPGTQAPTNDYRLGLTFVDSNTVIGNQGSSAKITDFDPTATTLSGTGATISGSVALNAADRPIDYAVIGGRSLLATINTNSSVVSVYDITNPAGASLLVTGSTATGSLSANANGTGGMHWGAVNGNSATLYAMSTNQGIQAFTFSLASSLSWNTTSGTWTNGAVSPSPWSGGGTFGDGDDASFGSGASGTVTVSGSVAPGTFTIDATSDYLFATSTGNLISGSTSLSKSGAGVAVFSGPNAWAGGTTLSAGTLRAGANSSLGTGTLHLDGGTIASDGASPRSFGNAVSVGGNVTVGDGTGTGHVSFSGNVDLGGVTRTLTTVVDTTISGTIGNGGLTKAGTGTLTLAGSHSYAGPTSVQAGTLSLSGTIAASAVTVDAGGTLAGNGFLGSSLSVLASGTLSPGNSPGRIDAASLSLAAGSTTVMEVVGSGSAAGVAGTDYDTVVIGGAATYGGALSIVFSNASPFTGGTFFDLFQVSGSASNSFASIATSGYTPYTNLIWSKDGSGVWTSSLTSGGQELQYSPLSGKLTVLDMNAVPEIDPTGIGSVLGLIAGTLGLLERRRAKRGRG